MVLQGDEVYYFVYLRYRDRKLFFFESADDDADDTDTATPTA